MILFVPNLRTHGLKKKILDPKSYPPPSCSLARHLVGKMAIFIPHLSSSPKHWRQNEQTVSPFQTSPGTQPISKSPVVQTGLLASGICEAILLVNFNRSFPGSIHRWDRQHIITQFSPIYKWYIYIYTANWVNIYHLPPIKGSRNTY